jgi:pyruvate, water dikinase
VIPAFGGKAAHYSVFPHMDNTLVPYPDGFIVPVSYYVAFMQENGFFSKIDTLLADEAFQNNPAVRDAQLAALRDEMKAAPIDAELESMILDKLAAEFPGIPMRFRSSTNAEDLEGFTGAGLYTSKTGNPNDPSRPVADAIRTVWSSVWYFRAFEEREYRGISHKEVGMALLVHRSFPDEEANGVAVTANIFDTSGMMPGFYVNVQFGEESVVKPPPGITTDQFILQYDMPGQPVTYIAHSNLVASDNSVLTRSQILDLGAALNEIHSFFRPAYGTGGADQFYAMDVEFKFDGEPGEIPQLFIKQARPYPGWGSVE